MRECYNLHPKRSDSLCRNENVQEFQEDFTEPVSNDEKVVENDFSSLFVGNIYDGHNKDIWGFEHPDPTQTHHPGACVSYDDSSCESTLLKGTSRAPDERYANSYVAIEHQDKEVLREVTFFQLKPYPIRLHKMKKLHNYGLRGALAASDLEKLVSCLGSSL